MYIGVVIALGIFLILSQAIVSLIFSMYDLLTYSRAKITARHLAIQEIELIRNAPFDDVGTVGGIPPGIFPQTQNVLRNGQIYTVRTQVYYIDDPFDGQTPDDMNPADYKRVRVEVSWQGVSPGAGVSLVSDVAPRGIEQTIGGGTLSILVFDSSGLPVPQASVQLVASSVNPPINATYLTNENGRVMLPGAPACSDCYQIIVSRSGFSTERTYSTSEITNPTKPHITVIEGELVETSFSIDRYASLAINTTGDRDSGFTPLGNQVIRVRGEKILGTDGQDNPIYKFDQEVVTDGLGELSIDQLEWDTYHISLPDDTVYSIAGTNPISPFITSPQDTINLSVALADRSAHNLLVVFQDGAMNPIEGVEAFLYLDEEEIASASAGLVDTPDFGQVFFENLTADIYELVTNATGYLEFTGNTNIVGNTKEFIILSEE